MKNKKILVLMAMMVTLSGTLTACGLFGDKDKKEEQIIVETTPTPIPTATPEPTPTIAPDVQNTTYTSADKTVSIQLPDATWANKTDQTDIVSFESPEQGKILILHGTGDDMASVLIPTSQDTAEAMEQAADMTAGTDFEIQNFTNAQSGSMQVYSYTVKYLNTDKSGGVAYSVNKYYSDDTQYYSVVGTVTGDDTVLANVQKSVDSFQILGTAAAGTDTAGTAGTGDAAAGTDSGSGTSDSGAEAGGTGSSAGGVDLDANGNLSDAALSDTSQTRTIYRNSDGQALVVMADGNGGWIDYDGRPYTFSGESDVYDEDGVDYYYHGEAADVYYMSPYDSDYDSSYDSSYDDYDSDYDDSYSEE